MKKTLVYPFNIQFNSILKNYRYIQDIEINSLVRPIGWRNNQTKYTLGKNEIVVSDDFENEVKNNEMVWFIESQTNLDIKKHILPKIKYAIKEGKSIIYTRNDIQELEKELSKFEISKLNTFKSEYDIEEGLSSILQVNTPIIFICDIFGNLDTLDVQIKLGEEIKNRGYSILQISSKKEGCVFDFEKIPDYMLEEKISSRKKILNFNKYIKNLEVTYKADLIILEIPNELFPFSKKMVSNFGITAYEISNAITNDSGILCMTYDVYQN
ncbi:MAG: TIGR04066 family peptide maturation system protein, partial [Clostridioides sp.]|nr:TIGR04066 family peptide maturation system protein [Clostridioides sp.]